MSKSTETNKSLSAFAQKALQRLHDKKSIKYATLFIPSLDETIKIRNLSYVEIVEISEIDETSDPNRSNKYTVYNSVVEPNLKDIASELKNAGEITEYMDVIDMFTLSEISEIASEVMILSGAMGNKKVAVVEELKN